MVSNSCKYTVNQVVWTIRIRKVRFPKLNSHRELEAFVDICLILDDQDPKSEIYKIKFAPWIRGFCRYLSFWTIRTRKVRFPKLNSHRELGAFVDICIILFLKFDFGRWPVLIGLIGPIRSFFRGRTFSDTCGARTFFISIIRSVLIHPCAKSAQVAPCWTQVGLKLAKLARVRPNKMPSAAKSTPSRLRLGQVGPCSSPRIPSYHTPQLWKAVLDPHNNFPSASSPAHSIP